MRRFVTNVFDEWVYASSAYTANMYNELLGSVDQLSIQAIADAASGTSVTLTVTCESSSDARTWSSNGAPISSFAIDNEVTNVAVGNVGGGPVQMHQPLVRFKIGLAGTTPKARVRLLVCGRDTSKRPNGMAPMDMPEPSRLAAAGPGANATPRGTDASTSRREAMGAPPMVMPSAANGTVRPQTVRTRRTAR